MSNKMIDPNDLGPSQIRQAIEQLPEGMRKSITGVTRHPEPLTDSQSPEVIRKANLRALKAKRRDLVASLIALDIEIFRAEDAEHNSGLTSEAIQAWIGTALGLMAAQGRVTFLLRELIDENPHAAISFATWESELAAMHRERLLFFAGDKIVLTGATKK